MFGLFGFLSQLDLPLTSHGFEFNLGERYGFVDNFQSQNFSRLGTLFKLLSKRGAGFLANVFHHFTLDLDGFGLFSLALVDFGANLHQLFGNADLARFWDSKSIEILNVLNYFCHRH